MGDEAVQKHFSLMKWGSDEDKDTEYSFRAWVHHTWISASEEPLKFRSYFPPAQYKTVEDKRAFTLALNDYLDGKDWSHVEVAQGGKLAYSFEKNSIKA